MNRKHILWVTRTAIFIALLIAAQAVTKPFGQFVTGSSVNFILVSACVLGGLASAATVAVVSPMFAFFFGIGPVFPLIIPFQMLGNLVIVTAVHFISGKSFAKLSLNSYIRFGVGAVVGSVLKFAVLWVGVVQIALPLIPDIKPPQVTALSTMFAWPQLVTALIGSGIAVVVMPVLMRALRHTEVGNA